MLLSVNVDNLPHKFCRITKEYSNQHFIIKQVHVAACNEAFITVH